MVYNLAKKSVSEIIPVFQSTYNCINSFVGSKPHSNIFEPIAFAVLSNVLRSENFTPSIVRFLRSMSIVLNILVR